MWESRVLRRAFERLELHEGKLSRAVLRGGGGGDVTSLPDPGWATTPVYPAHRLAGRASISFAVRRGRLFVLLGRPSGELLLADALEDGLIELIARPEIGHFEFLDLLFDVDDPASCGLLKNAERADHLQAAPRGLPGTVSVIDENQVGFQFEGQRDRRHLSPTKLRGAGMGCVLDRDPFGGTARPCPNRFRAPPVRKLLDRRRRDIHSPEDRGENMNRLGED